ncbi:MAG: hypothetical protein Q7J77_08960 [Undibacterium sp.]|nr:hypothetical protein [Undibacterium sp.]
MKNQSRATAINGKIPSIRQFLADLSHHSPKMDGSFTGAKAPFFYLAFNTTGQGGKMQRDFIVAMRLLTNKQEVI